MELTGINNMLFSVRLNKEKNIFLWLFSLGLRVRFCSKLWARLFFFLI